jgi:thiol:disulfide interchange protein DsbD
MYYTTRKHSFFLGLIFLSFVWSWSVRGEDKPINENPLTASAHINPLKVTPGAQAQLVIDMNLPPHHHAYLEQFKLKTISPDGVKVGSFEVTPIVDFMDKFSKKVKKGIEEKGQLVATIEFPTSIAHGNAAAVFELTYQACTPDYCLFPKKIQVTAKYEMADAAAVAPQTSSTSGGGILSGKLDINEALSQNIFLAFLLVFLAGVLTSLTPCVFPMIPITLASL